VGRPGRPLGRPVARAPEKRPAPPPGSGKKISPRSGHRASRAFGCRPPRYAAIAVANQSDKVPDIYKQDPRKVLEEIVERWIAADEAEKAEKAIDVTPPVEPAPVEVKPNPDDDGIDGELA